MALDRRQPPLRRPSAVAVGDDRDVCALRPSNLEDLFFLGLQQAIDLGRRRVGALLQLGLGAALVVLADLALLLQLAQVVHDVAADVADGDLALLADAVDDLDHLAAALLVELGDLQPDHVAVVGGRQPEVGLHDRLLDHRDRALVERGQGQQAGVGRRHLGELLDRRLGAVVVDQQAVEQVRRGAAGAHGGELVPARFDRLRHPLAGVGDELIGDLGQRSPSPLSGRGAHDRAHPLAADDPIYVAPGRPC